jgi:hypothetical protein
MRWLDMQLRCTFDVYSYTMPGRFSRPDAASRAARALPYASPSPSDRPVLEIELEIFHRPVSPSRATPADRSRAMCWHPPRQIAVRSPGMIMPRHTMHAGVR